MKADTGRPSAAATPKSPVVGVVGGVIVCVMVSIRGKQVWLAACAST